MHWFRDIYWIVASLVGTTLMKKMDYHFLSFQEFLIISQLGVGLADCLLPTRWDSVFWLAPSEVFRKQSRLVHMCPVVSKKKKVLFACIVVHTSASYSLSWSLFHQNLEALAGQLWWRCTIFHHLLFWAPWPIVDLCVNSYLQENFLWEIHSTCLKSEAPPV